MAYIANCFPGIFVPQDVNNSVDETNPVFLIPVCVAASQPLAYLPDSHVGPAPPVAFPTVLPVSFFHLPFSVRHVHDAVSLPLTDLVIAIVSAVVL